MSGKKKKTPPKAQKNKMASQAKQVTVEIDGDRLSGVPKLLVILAMVLITVACWVLGIRADGVPHAVSVRDVPTYTGSAYAVINDNRPLFTEEEIYTHSYEYYAPLDELERCVYAMACLGKDLMPTGERGVIRQVRPSGWLQAQYESVDGGNLYNRCHLIGWQLSGEDANTGNLITGTRYMNVEGMLPFENMVADYIKETGNHVMYRVTPIFAGDELVARGVQLEALSVEDGGDGICFHVYVYNVQPGIGIDYATGESWME